MGIKMIRYSKINRCMYKIGAMIDSWNSKRQDTQYRKKYPDYQGETPYDNGEMKFIWGIKAADDFCKAQACLYTMNDIDITYIRKTKRYVLGIETAYWFDDKSREVKYLESLLDAFTEYMRTSGLDIEEPYRFWMAQPQALLEAESIPELYTNFKIFVEGYKALYNNERKDNYDSKLQEA